MAENPVNATRKGGFTVNTERGPSPAEKGSPNGHKPTLKERAVHQLREFLVMFIYLWALFALLVINQSIVLAREAQDYQAHGFAILNALILAKVLLIGEDLRLGERFRDRPGRVPADGSWFRRVLWQPLPSERRGGA